MLKRIEIQPEMIDENDVAMIVVAVGSSENFAQKMSNASNTYPHMIPLVIDNIIKWSLLCNTPATEYIAPAAAPDIIESSPKPLTSEHVMVVIIVGIIQSTPDNNKDWMLILSLVLLSKISINMGNSSLNKATPNRIGSAAPRID